MKPVTKGIVIGGGLVLLSFLAFAANKVKTVQAIFDRMSIEPADISALKVTGSFPNFYINFKLDIKITNPTPLALSVSTGSLAVLRSIKLYRKGKYLGKADLNISTIDVPANSSTTFKHIPFSVAAQAALENAMTIESFDMSELGIVATVVVLGNEYEITS